MSAHHDDGSATEEDENDTSPDTIQLCNVDLALILLFNVVLISPTLSVTVEISSSFLSSLILPSDAEQWLIPLFLQH